MLRKLGLMALLLTLGVGLAATTLAPPANADVVVKEETRFYPITGNNGRELSREMLRGGGQQINLRHAIAATATRFDVGEADIGVEGGRCVVKDVTVTLHITYLYPKWESRGRASKQLRAAWDRFYAELQRHERTHGRIAQEGAAELEKELKRTSGTVLFGCNDFGRFSMLRINALVHRLKQRQLAFDRRENLRTSRITQLQVALIQTD